MSTPSRSRTLLGRAAAALLGVVLGLLLLEGGLRVAGVVIAGSDRARVGHVDGGEGLRILCLGACYTLGVGVEPTDAYPAQLERLLAARDPARNVQVINGGVRSKGVDFFAERIVPLLDEHRPDVLVVNVNDRILYRVSEERRQSILPVGIRKLLAPSRVFRVARLLDGPPVPLADYNSDEAVTLGYEAERQRSKLLAVTRAHPEDPTGWIELARLHDAHGQYSLALSALGRAADSGAEGVEIERFKARLAVLAGRYALASSTLKRLRMTASESETEVRRAYAGELLARFRATPVAELVSIGMDTMDAYAELGEWGVAESIAGDVVARVPGAAEVYDYRSFFLAIRSGDKACTPDVDAFFEKDTSSSQSAAEFGLYAEDARASDTNARVFWEVLDANLGAIVRAARERGVRVVVEDLSSMPQQRPVLAAEAQMLDVSYIKVQDTLAGYPDRAALMHPQQHLRLSVKGNEVVAETILAGLEREGMLE